MACVSMESWMEVASELPALEIEEDAGDQARRSRRGERKPSRRSRVREETRLREERKKLVEEALKNPPIRKEEEEEEDILIVDEEEADQDEMRMFRRSWEQCFGPSCGSFQDNTSLGPMRYTEGIIPEYACSESLVQIFSVQVTDLKHGLKWPLHVYGYVAVRDLLDHNRNLVFERTRDNCQILTEQDSCLLLTGPSRAVVIVNPVTFEVDLKVKGETESEDKVLCLKFFEHNTATFYEKDAPIIRRCHLSKRSMLELKFSVLVQAVEATVVSAKVVDGSWLDHYRGRVVCHTASASKEDIVLLDSHQEGRMPVTCDGEIELSRSVVCVELCGQLIFRMVASRVSDNKVIADGAAIFRPRLGGKSRGTCDLGFCQVEITVAWSLFSVLEDLHLRNRL